MCQRLNPVLLAAGLSLAAAPAAARAQDKEPVFKTISPQQIEQVLRELGFEFEKQPPKGGGKLQSWRFMISGYPVLLLSDGTDMQLYAGYEAKVSLSRINEWNRGKRWGRAYITQDNKGVALESDLDFEGGVSLNGIKESIKLYRALLEEFARFIQQE
jgi:Putative bacterial sensory transduction regulator